MHGIMIYNKTENQNNTEVLIAKEGKMFRTLNGAFLVLKLKDGIKYIEGASKGNYNPRQTLTRYRFKETEQKFDLSGLKIHRTDENEFKSAYQMMNLKQLKDDAQKTTRQVDSGLRVNYKFITAYIKYYTIFIPDSI